MALRYFTTDIIGFSTAITTASNDTIIITEGTDIVATGSDAIAGGGGASANVSIQVDGTLAGTMLGISMSGWTGSNTVVVGQTGRIIGDLSGAILAAGTDAAVYNSGELTSYGTGWSTVLFSSDRAYLFNEGTIFGSQSTSDTVSFLYTLGSSTNTLINTGSIISTSGQDTGTANVAFVGGNGAIDQVFNSGLISGDVRLNGGNDLFDGAGGQVIGVVYGDVGDDLLRGSSHGDTLDGGANNDRIGGKDGDDSILGQDGDDLLFGDGGDDTLDGGNGNDWLRGGLGDDLLRGGIGNDTLDGLDGNDTLGGKENNDIVNGGAGDDTLFGDAGFDTLNGGFGNDALRGGTEADTFQFSRNWGSDQVFSYENSLDRLDFTGLASVGVHSAANLTISVEVGNTIIRHGGQDITLVGITSVDTSNWLFA